MRGLSFLFAWLLAVSCASPVVRPVALGPDGTPLLRQCKLPVEVSIAEEMPPDLRALVLAGFFYWNDVAGAELFVAGPLLGADDPLPLFGVAGAQIGDGETAPEGAIGVTYSAVAPDGCLALTYVDYNPKWFLEMTPEAQTTIVRHEAGHVLGLDHSPYPGDLMFYAWLGLGDPIAAGIWEKLELAARYNLPRSNK